MSCPFIRYNYEKNCEECKLNNKPTHASLTCDFDYDESCAEYKAQIDNKNKKIKK